MFGRVILVSCFVVTAAAVAGRVRFTFRSIPTRVRALEALDEDEESVAKSCIQMGESGISGVCGLRRRC